MRLVTTVSGILVGLLCLLPVSVWGMIASNVSQNPLVAIDDAGISLFLGASVDVESGDMAYTIQGPEDGGWKSKLEWPLDGISYIGGIVSANLGGRLRLNAGAWKNLDDGAGTMQDRDWFDQLSGLLEATYGDATAIYGEFETAVKATQFDVNLRYDFLKRSPIVFGVMLGYSYTKWEWVAANGYQTSPIPRYNVGNVTGTGITYTEKVNVPYLGLAVSLLPANSSLGVNLYTLYSPIARCDDIDDHVVRYKESTGKTKGKFFALGGNVLWKFSGSWSLTGTINYAGYNLEGTQNQYFYGGEDVGTEFNDIDMTVEGHQFSLGLMIGYKL